MRPALILRQRKQRYVNGAYVNVPNAGMADYETAYWGPNVDRLRGVKAKYDPENFFRVNQNIQPAGKTKAEEAAAI